MPKISKQKSESRKQAILEAAVICFAEKGYHATSMRQIFAQVQLSAGAVYNYFASKEAILQALAERDAKRATMIIKKLDATHVSSLAELIRIFIADLTRAEQLQLARLQLTISAELSTNASLKAAVYSAREMLEDTVTTFLRSYFEHHSGPTEQAPQLARLYFMIYTGALQMIALGQKPDFAYLEQQLERLAQ